MKQERRRAVRTTAAAYALMTPALVLLILFMIVPLAGNVILMFFDFDAVSAPQFTEFANFERMVRDRRFWIALRNSMLFLATVPLTQLLAVLLAVFVNRKSRIVRILRVCLFVPAAVSEVASSIIWGYLIGDGMTAAFLKALHLDILSGDPLSDSRTAILVLMMITVWQNAGYYMLVYLAELQSIPGEIAEASALDGAAGWQTAFFVLIPLLKNGIRICTLNAIIRAVSIFDLVFIMTEGGPNDATLVLNYYSYKEAFENFRFGYSAAIGSVQSIVTYIVSVVLYAGAGRREREGRSR